MKKALILCFFLCMSRGECATTFLPPLHPLGTSNNIQSYTTTSFANPFGNRQNIDYPGISQIEIKLYGRTYVNQSISARLSRLERSLFSTTYSNSTNEQRIDNIISNFNQINKYPNISQNVLSKIEMRIFNQNYPQNGSLRRIERLEQQLFGAVQSGDLDARYKALQAAAGNYNRNYNSLNPYSISPYNMNSLNTNSGVKGSLKNLAGALGSSFLGGNMTGFTPPITPFYDNYHNQYPSGYGMYKGYRTNYGYRDSFQNYGTGTGVTILD